MNGRDHYDEAERLLMVGAGNPLDIWAALTHAVLALVATEHESTEEIHNLAAALEVQATGDDHDPYPVPGGMS